MVGMKRPEVNPKDSTLGLLHTTTKIKYWVCQHLKKLQLRNFNFQYLKSLDLPFCVYILLSEKDFLLYIGYTSDLKRRVEEHNQGRNLITSFRRPLICIFAEYFLFESEARKRESYFKTTMGKKAIRLMLKTTLIKLGYKADSLKRLVIENE